MCVDILFCCGKTATVIERLYRLELQFSVALEEFALEEESVSYRYRFLQVRHSRSVFLYVHLDRLFHHRSSRYRLFCYYRRSNLHYRLWFYNRCRLLHNGCHHYRLFCYYRRSLHHGLWLHNRCRLLRDRHKVHLLVYVCVFVYVNVCVNINLLVKHHLHIALVLFHFL